MDIHSIAIASWINNKIIEGKYEFPSFDIRTKYLSENIMSDDPIWSPSILNYNIESPELFISYLAKFSQLNRNAGYYNSPTLFWNTLRC